MVQPPIMFIDSESRSDLQVTIINGNQKLLKQNKKKKAKMKRNSGPFEPQKFHHVLIIKRVKWATVVC